MRAKKAQSPQPTARWAKTKKNLVDDREYCVTRSSEGAAGSTYRAYEYAFQFGTSTYRIAFTLRFPQCTNYDEPQQSACKAEQSSYDIDGLVDRMRGRSR